MESLISTQAKERTIWYVGQTDYKLHVISNVWWMGYCCLALIIDCDIPLKSVENRVAPTPIHSSSHELSPMTVGPLFIIIHKYWHSYCRALTSTLSDPPLQLPRPAWITRRAASRRGSFILSSVTEGWLGLLLAISVRSNSNFVTLTFYRIQPEMAIINPWISDVLMDLIIQVISYFVT